MPLLRFDLIEGRSPEDLRTLLAAAHEAMLEAVQVPPGDRDQIVHEHPPAHLIVEDTGLGIPRTERCVVLQVTTRPRSRAMKEAFDRLLVERLQERCGIAPTDVVVSMVSNTDDDWSFGYGRAQFLTGEL
ncbi:tautomerase family protein [Methylobacterium terricola]|uniref:Tautomerase family protein n=1 Tax=Methylobacterium terricola TaxID=2583531 RepID=A0A5C4L4M8_9HYPH|nr:tautomerase family protein [Methylobacterium terricola]TNC04975.1 tautomerase family protein [Methylobacterium terricola]